MYFWQYTFIMILPWHQSFVGNHNTIFVYLAGNARWHCWRPCYKYCSCIGFQHSPSRSRAVVPDTMCCHISKGIISCIRKGQLWSRIESVKIWYVDSSFVAETLAMSPNVSIICMNATQVKVSELMLVSGKATTGDDYQEAQLFCYLLAPLIRVQILQPLWTYQPI